MRLICLRIGDYFSSQATRSKTLFNLLRLFIDAFIVDIGPPTFNMIGFNFGSLILYIDPYSSPVWCLLLSVALGYFRKTKPESEFYNVLFVRVRVCV